LVGEAERVDSVQALEVEMVPHSRQDGQIAEFVEEVSIHAAKHTFLALQVVLQQSAAVIIDAAQPARMPDARRAPLQQGPHGLPGGGFEARFEADVRLAGRG